MPRGKSLDELRAATSMPLPLRGAHRRLNGGSSDAESGAEEPGDGVSRAKAARSAGMAGQLAGNPDAPRPPHVVAGGAGLQPGPGASLPGLAASVNIAAGPTPPPFDPEILFPISDDESAEADDPLLWEVGR